MDKTLDDIIKENNSGLKRFRRGGNFRGGRVNDRQRNPYANRQRRDFGGRRDFNDNRRGFNNNRRGFNNRREFNDNRREFDDNRREFDDSRRNFNDNRRGLNTMDRELTGRRQNFRRGGRPQGIRRVRRFNGQRDFGYNDGMMRVCFY